MLWALIAATVSDVAVVGGCVALLMAMSAGSGSDLVGWALLAGVVFTLACLATSWWLYAHQRDSAVWVAFAPLALVAFVAGGTRLMIAMRRRTRSLRMLWFAWRTRSKAR